MRFRGAAPGLTRGTNLLAVVLVALNAVPVARGEAIAHVTLSGSASLPGVDLRTEHPTRDVYYMIFDRYANERILREQFSFNNAPFLGWLESRGFFVAHDSVANYPKTTHSLDASLSMDYLSRPPGEAGRTGNWGPLIDMLNANRVSRGFQWLGYRYYHVGSWFTPTAQDPTADRNYVYRSASEFSGVLWETTIGPTLLGALGVQDPLSFQRAQYERYFYQFDAIDRISQDPAPTYTFVHFTLPHPPYVIDRHGDFMTHEEVLARGGGASYLEQLRYANKRIEQMVRTLLAGPERTDPILVFQSDEGPHPHGLVADELGYDWTKASVEDLSRKLRILNAYYLPGHGDPRPFDTISPVNSFRLIFDRYFGADLPLLEDRTYVFTDASHPYDFTDVTDRLAAQPDVRASSGPIP